MRFVHSNVNEEPKLVLIKAVKNAKEFLKIEKPLFIYNKQGEYTKEILTKGEKERTMKRKFIPSSNANRKFGGYHI